MPELPDVEIYRKTAEKASNHKIAYIKKHDKSFDSLSDNEFEKLFKNKTITKTERHGKHLLLYTNDNHTMILHFGMTGDLRYGPDKDDLPKYTKIEIDFDNHKRLNYISKRKLGFVKATDNVNQFLEENEIGQDVLELSKSAFIDSIKSKKSMIKSALMDQSVTSGIGNVYSDEILFQCGLHPKTKTSDLDENDWDHLYECMQNVMETAIESEARPSKLPDDFLTKHRNEGEECPKCDGHIEKIKISGRGMYYCPSCQQPKK
jgi:formamidopyrimidine-DNA glycosylase